MQRTFQERVMGVVRGIPSGKLLTYSQVARLAKSPRAFRAVGTILKQNFDPTIPCHRVIRADGTIGQYNRGGGKRKTALLRQEGVFFRSGRADPRVCATQ